MSDPTQETHQQMIDAYKRMATEGRYRPMAPSDGLGNITVPSDELDLDAEAEQYAQRWWTEEDGADFFIGVGDFSTRPATIFAIEAARLLCGGDPKTAARLLRFALEEAEAQAADPARR